MPPAKMPSRPIKAAWPSTVLTIWPRRMPMARSMPNSRVCSMTFIVSVLIDAQRPDQQAERQQHPQAAGDSGHHGIDQLQKFGKRLQQEAVLAGKALQLGLQLRRPCPART